MMPLMYLSSTDFAGGEPRGQGPNTHGTACKSFTTISLFFVKVSSSLLVSLQSCLYVFADGGLPEALTLED